MEALKIEEWELLSFFEVEPQRYDTHEEWFVDQSVYVVKRGQITLRFAITPYCRDIYLSLKSDDGFTYDFESSGARAVEVLSENAVETLLIHLGTGAYLSLRLKPSIVLIQRPDASG